MVSRWTTGLSQGAWLPARETPIPPGSVSGQTFTSSASSGGIPASVVSSENINGGSVCVITPSRCDHSKELNAEFFAQMAPGVIIVIDSEYPADSRAGRQSVMTISNLNNKLKHSYDALKATEDGVKQEINGLRVYAESILREGRSLDDIEEKLKGDADISFSDFKHTLPTYVYKRYRILGVKAQVATGLRSLDPSKPKPDGPFSAGVNGCHRVFPYWTLPPSPENLAVGFMLTESSNGGLTIGSWTSETARCTTPLTIDRTFFLRTSQDDSMPVVSYFYPFGTVVERARYVTDEKNVATLLMAGFPSSKQPVLARDSQLVVNIQMHGQIISEWF